MKYSRGTVLNYSSCCPHILTTLLSCVTRDHIETWIGWAKRIMRGLLNLHLSTRDKRLKAYLDIDIDRISMYIEQAEHTLSNMGSEAF